MNSKKKQKKKNVIPGDIPTERRLTIALNHLVQAERQVNLVSWNSSSITDPIEQAKKRLKEVLLDLNILGLV